VERKAKSKIGSLDSATLNPGGSEQRVINMGGDTGADRRDMPPPIIGQGDNI